MNYVLKHAMNEWILHKTLSENTPTIEGKKIEEEGGGLEDIVYLKRGSSENLRNFIG